MEINVIKNEPEELNLEFKTTDTTIPDLLAAELLKQKSVSFAGVVKDHPVFSNSVLVVKAKDAQQALLKAIENLKKEFSIKF
ncbi:MAG: RpoL/Rpb11 RNA polymerase subunit family protein [Candidatus Micrarchaeia archaeon]